MLCCFKALCWTPGSLKGHSIHPYFIPALPGPHRARSPPCPDLPCSSSLQDIFRTLQGRGCLVEQTIEQLYSEPLGKFLADRCAGRVGHTVCDLKPGGTVGASVVQWWLHGG